MSEKFRLKFDGQMKGKRTFEREMLEYSYHLSHPKGDICNKLKKRGKKDS